MDGSNSLQLFTYTQSPRRFPMKSRNIVVRSVIRLIQFFQHIWLLIQMKAQAMFDVILSYFVTWLCRYYQQAHFTEY